ncbi:MAG: hypothetical protein U9R29_04120 [Thermodesulfobacteriota bacterium]|nr:hypothetical protein [Thermodesulfobacteriota bacterium]
MPYTTYVTNQRELFTGSLRLWKQSLGPLVILTLLLLVLAWIPLLNLVMAAGYCRYILHLCRNEAAETSDLFRTWDCLIPLLIYSIVLVVISFVLMIIPIIGVIIATLLTSITLPGFVAIVDRQMGVIDALQWSFTTIQNDLIGWGFTLLCSIILTGLGTLLFGLGALFTIPLATIIFVQQYLHHQPSPPFAA